MEHIWVSQPHSEINSQGLPWWIVGKVDFGPSGVGQVIYLTYKMATLCDGLIQVFVYKYLCFVNICNNI